MSGKMPPASSHTGFARRRTGGYGKFYDQTADLADQAGNESQEKKGPKKIDTGPGGIS
jgi:hypothetical protein